MLHLEREKTLRQLFLTLSIMYVVVISMFLFFTLPTEKQLETNWTISFPQAGDILKTGRAVDFHLFLEDEYGQPIEDATMKVVFDRPGTVHQIEKTFSRVENGLYENDIIFSVPGTWIAMIEVTKGDRIYRNQILFDVEGPVIADADRDPNDSFRLTQNLPKDVELLLNDIPVHK